MAMTASCNSCKGCCSAEQYCAENPGVDDCPGTKIVDGDGPAIVNPGSGTVNELANTFNLGPAPRTPLGKHPEPKSKKSFSDVSVGPDPVQPRTHSDKIAPNKNKKETERTRHDIKDNGGN